jgi:hypothetical protein
MLEFNEYEWEGLQKNDERNYVDAVRGDLVDRDPALADDATLGERLMEAWERTQELGLEDERNIVQFLQIEAYAPQFWRNVAVNAWLRSVGATPDERFEALRAVTASKLRDRQEPKETNKETE